MENGLAIPKIIKHGVTTPRYIFKKFKNIHPRKNLYMCAQHSSIINLGQKVKITQIPINR